MLGPAESLQCPCSVDRRYAGASAYQHILSVLPVRCSCCTKPCEFTLINRGHPFMLERIMRIASAVLGMRQLALKKVPLTIER